MNKQAASEQFKSTYKAKYCAVHAVKGKQKGGRAGGLGKSKGRGGLVLPAHIPQKEAKLYIPEGASIWCSPTRGEWNGHFPPNKRVHEPYARNGNSEDALKACLK